MLALCRRQKLADADAWRPILLKTSRAWHSTGSRGPVVMFPRPRASRPSTRSGGRVPIGQRAPVAGADADKEQDARIKRLCRRELAGASRNARCRGRKRCSHCGPTGQQADNACSEWIAGAMGSAAHNRSSVPSQRRWWPFAPAFVRFARPCRCPPRPKHRRLPIRSSSPGGETMPPAEILPSPKPATPEPNRIR